MISIEWTAEDGWHTPRIVPYQNLSLDPSTCVFHYAFECFEGMKAYKDKTGGTRLFRPNKNMERLNKSSARIALPKFDGDELVKLIGEFVKLEDRFIPESVNPVSTLDDPSNLSQCPWLLSVPPAHYDWHSEDSGCWSSWLRPSVCYC